MRATASEPATGDRAVTYTRPPRPASAVAVASPIPVFAPVTRKVRPARDADAISAKKQTLLDRYLLVDQAQVDALAVPDDARDHASSGASRNVFHGVGFVQPIDARWNPPRSSTLDSAEKAAALRNFRQQISEP
jgi:hypothetical protein